MPFTSVLSQDHIKHLDLLKKEQIEEIRAQAREEILNEQTKKAMKELKEVFKAEQRASLEPEYEKVLIAIDVPGASTVLLIDGKRYHHGQVVEMPEHMARSAREMMQNAWFAERLAGNPNAKNYIPPATKELYWQRPGDTPLRRESASLAQLNRV